MSDKSHDDIPLPRKNGCQREWIQALITWAMSTEVKKAKLVPSIVNRINRSAEERPKLQMVCQQGLAANSVEWCDEQEGFSKFLQWLRKKLKLEDPTKEAVRLEELRQMKRKDGEKLADFIFRFQFALQEVKADGERFVERQLCFRFYNALQMDRTQAENLKTLFPLKDLTDNIDPADAKFHELAAVVEGTLCLSLIHI